MARKENVDREGKARAFDAYCKKVIRNEARDHYAARERQRQHEVMLSELPACDAWQAAEEDRYFARYATFALLDGMVDIADPVLGSALALLEQRKRDIILLAYCFGYSDQRIAEALGMLRGTVQYQRTQTLLQLRRLMGSQEAEL